MKIAKILSLLLVVCMAVAVFASCGQDTDKATIPDPLAGKTHAEISKQLYDAVLGDFYDYYEKATEAETVSERYALMAIAEAKLLESGIMLPSTAKGGNYAISRVVPYTVTPTLWGNDSDRFHQLIVLDGDQAPLLPAERDELKALWKSSATSAEYEAAAKAYLEEKGYKRLLSIKWHILPILRHGMSSIPISPPTPRRSSIPMMVFWNMI